MLSGRFLISVTLTALIATPALPQTRADGNTSSAVSTVLRLSTPPNLRAALRAWGLDRQSRTMRFVKRSVTSDRAEFDRITSTGGTSGSSTLDNLVITRNSVPGESFGQFNIQGRNWVRSDGSRVGAFTLNGLRGDFDLETVIASVDDVIGNQTPPTNVSNASDVVIGSLTLTDVFLAPTAPNDKTSMTAAEISLTNIASNTDVVRFEGLTLRNFVYKDDDFEMKLGLVQMKDAGPGFSELFNARKSATGTPLDVMAQALGSLSMSNVSLTFLKAGAKTPPIGTLTLANFQLSGVKNGIVDQFSFSNFKAQGIAANQAWDFNLARLSMSGINLRYFSELGRAINASVSSVKPRRADQGEPVTPPKDVVAAPTVPEVMLANLLPGGPLDSGFTGFDLADLRVSGGGLLFLIDRIALQQERNQAGIITKTDFAPTQMSFSWPNPRGTGISGMATILAGLQVNEIVARISVAARFDPTTDTLSLSSYRFEVGQWGSFDLGFTMRGLQAFMEKTSFSEIIKASIPTEVASPKASRAILKNMAELYSSIQFVSGRIVLADLGGINKAVALGPVMARNTRSSAPTSLTPSQIRNQRIEWATKPRADAGDKTKPAFDRQANLAVARWLENGGAIAVTMTPTNPLSVSELFEADVATSGRLGLRITNQPPVTR